jgi:hypothetical protein
MHLKRYIVDGSRATDLSLAAALRLADDVHWYRRTPGWFTGLFPSEAVKGLSAKGSLKFLPDRRLAPCLNLNDFQTYCDRSEAPSPGLNQVLQMISAPSAWKRATGKGVSIAVVDSGINGDAREFPDWKKAGGWSHDGSDPWTDSCGHGTMCAVIAAGSPEPVARLCGVAPDAMLYSCKTNYNVSEIVAAYEWIEDQHDKYQKPIVVTNSFGYEDSSSPAEDHEQMLPDHLVTITIRRMVARGIPMVFAAGNNHPTNRPTQCSPNTIWAWASLPEVFTVTEVDENLGIRPYSSRGPGKWSKPGCAKPDCAAPAFGWILFGDTYKPSVEGWGTSGAAPQAAGLLAMMCEQRPTFKPHQHYDRIRKNCQKLPLAKHCAGCGLLNCERSLY